MADVAIHCMQGRLLAPQEGRFQAFPRGRWEQELALAPQARLDGIEWIYETYGAEENPIADDAGVARLRSVAAGHGVVVESLCADWFMDRPLIGDDDGPARLFWMAERARAAGIARFVIPCVDASRLATADDRDALVATLGEALPMLEAHGVELHLETDLGPAEFAALLLDRLDHPLVKANYDIGNSASLGYDTAEEWDAYGDRIGSVHVKDRVRGGGTVPLGTGDADVRTTFTLMHARGWQRPLVLQVARGADGDEPAWVGRAADAVRALWQETAA